jgi:hypothetical protein
MGKKLKIVNESKERIVYWDIVKGITILMSLTVTYVLPVLRGSLYRWVFTSPHIGKNQHQERIVRCRY